MTIEINGEPYEALVGVSNDLPRHALLGKDFPAFYDLLNNVEIAPKDSLVVTRAQTKQKLKQRGKETEEEQKCEVKPKPLDNANQDVTQAFKDMDVESLMYQPPKERKYKSRSQKRKERKEHSTMKEEDQEDVLDIDPKTIQDLQEADKTLEGLRQKEFQQSKEDGVNTMFKDGIMYRQVKSDDNRELTEQLVLPKQCREGVLKASHDIPLAGHLGKKKTLNRIKQRFYWPGMSKDVTDYYKSCETCQKTSKHQTKFKAPMQSMPIIEEPFSRRATTHRRTVWLKD